jgi:hypothetical protein
MPGQTASGAKRRRAGTRLSFNLAIAVVVLAAAVALVGAPANPTANARVNASPSVIGDRSGVRPAPGTWAVTIGIDDYPGRDLDLRSAVNDAETFDAMLDRAGVPRSHRLLLTDGTATAAAITGAADWLVAQTDTTATAVFFYAGHVRRLTTGNEAILAADQELVTDEELAQRLQPLRAHQTWITLATCYGAGFTELLAPGRILTAAAGPTQQAYENDHLKHSYLVEYMVRRELLRTHGRESIQEAFLAALRRISRDYPDRQPVQYDQMTGPLHLVQNMVS